MSGKITNTHSSVPTQTLNWAVNAAIEGGKEDTIYETSPVEPANLDFICEDTISELSLQCLSTGGMTSALNLACTCQKLNHYIIPCLQKLKDDSLLAMWKEASFSIIRQPTWPARLEMEKGKESDADWTNAYTRILNANAGEVRVHLKNPSNVEMFRNIKNLSITNCGIKIMPPEITLIMNLENIYFYRNKILFIPEFLGNFEKLKSLSLTDNQISNIPAYLIDKVCDGMALNLRGNPLLFIPEKERKEGLCPELSSNSGHPLLFCLWFSKFNNYDDPSRFSKFIKLCLSDTIDKEKITAELELLKNPMKTGILTLIKVVIDSCPTSEYSEWPEHLRVLDTLTTNNVDLFCKALRNVLDKI